MENYFVFNKVVVSKILFCIALFITTPMVLFSQNIEKTIPDFPFSIERVESKGSGKYGSTKIHVLLDEMYFIRKNLNELFAHLSKSYFDRPLFVTVFSDKQVLLKQIEWEKMGIHHYDDTTPARKEFFDKYLPPDKGYFQAFYFKNSLNENFDYSPRKNSGRLVTVTLRSNKKFINSPEFLFDSIKSGYIDGVKWILSQNPKLDINVTDSDSLTPLMWSLWLEHNEIAKLLIETNANVNTITSHGAALFSAINAENYEGIKLLIANKADVNVKSNQGKTALMSSVLYCNSQITKLLLQAGAEIGSKDNAGRTAITYACTNKEIIELLSTNKHN